VTGWTIRARRAGWRVSYRAHLVALVVLDALRWVLTAATLLTHRAHTATAEHGAVLAEVLDDSRFWQERSEFDRARYLQLVDRLLFNVDIDPKETR
jgi:hypothetical protein